MMRKIFLVIVSLLLPTLVMAQTTAYRLQQVTSAEAGGMYVFEQSERVMIGEIISSGINTTDDYKTAGLTGIENYVWTLESASSGNFYIKNIAENKYINNTSSTTIKLGTTYSSKWKIAFDSEGYALITNTSNSDRYLGYASLFDYYYKAYLESGYPNAITVYQLVEEQAQQLTGIEVTTLPYKLEYETGEVFNPEGMKVTATYELADGTTTQTDVTDKCTYAPAEPLTTDDEVITISYEGKTTTIQITVNPAPTYAVTLADMGVLLPYNDDGSTVTLPVRENMADYTFVGWSETECPEETLTCPELIVAGSYYPTKDVTLYPIFRTQSEGSSESWTLITDLSTLTSGTYALVVELDDGWHAFNGSISDKGMGAATEAFTFDNGTTSSLPSNAAELTFTFSGNEIVIANASGKYLTAGTSTGGHLKWDSSIKYWDLYTYEGVTYLRYKTSVQPMLYSTAQATPGFRCYDGTSTGSVICVARKGSIVSHYVSLPYHQTINSYATLFLGYDAIIPEGVEAYIATASDKENTINLEQLTDVIPAMTGVVLKASAPATYTLLVSQEEATPCNNNLLCGVLRATAVSDLLSAYDGKSLYGLQLRDGKPFFARLVLDTDDESHNTLAAHRAVLVLDGPAPATELRVGDGDETGLHGIELGKKVTAAKCYDLTGRRAENGVRGWVIEDGRLTYKR